MTRNYVEEFEALAKEIESNPLLEIINFKVNPPLSEQKVSDIELVIKHKLDQAIINFYRQMNGLQLEWRVRPELAEDEQEFTRIKDQYDDYRIQWPEDEAGSGPFAKINLLPLDDCLIERDWRKIIIPLPGETVEFVDKTYQHSEFSSRLKPFDIFSDYSCMAFFLDNENSNLNVLLLSDYYIEWDESRLTNFESYLEMLLVTRGIVESRSTIYKEHEGHKMSLLLTPKNYWDKHPQHIPKLFR